MTNGKYIKIDVILADIADYPFMEGITKREAAHSLVTLLGLVGAVMPLERTYKTIEIKEHKGALPTNIMYIHGVNNRGTTCTSKGIPMRYATDIYNSALHSDALKAQCNGTYVCENDVSNLYGGQLVDLPEVKTIGSEGEMNLQVWQASGSLRSEIKDNSYSINGSSIDTSFACGYVEIAYDAIKTDSNNFPMIPDDKPFREAFKYYLLKKAVEPEFFRGNVTQMVYAEINKQYAWYVGGAGNSLNMPNPDQMQAMINGLVRILPRGENHQDGWKSFTRPEIR